MIDNELALKAAIQLRQALPPGDDESLEQKIAAKLTKPADRERLAHQLDEAGADGGNLFFAITPVLEGTVSEQSISKAATAFEVETQRTALIRQLRTKINAKELTQIWLAIGAIVATITAAMMGDWIGRRNAYCLLCALSLLSTWTFYIGNTHYGTMFLVSTFFIGGCTASFYGWLPLYLPELFPTNVRATGQGFGYNFGRISQRSARCRQAR